MYIAYFLKKEVTESSSEVCKLEWKKNFSPKFASRTGEIKKKFTRSVDRKQRYFSRRRYCTCLKKENLWRRNETLTIYINYQHGIVLFCLVLLNMLLGYVEEIQKKVHCATGSTFADSLTLKKIILMLLVLSSSIGTLLEYTHNLLP